MNKFLLILFLIPINALSQDIKLIKFDHPNYSIEYPENWILDESEQDGTSFILYPKIESEKNFVENINLVKQDLRQNEFTLEQLKSLVETQISNMLNNTEIIVSKIIRKKGLTYHYILASGQASGMNFQTKIYTYPVKNNLFTLTLVSKAEDYENIKITSNKIMDSFSIK